jgi:PAS domain S-box-containing protein/diguanylate cyclase (GGDEF)-like protein
MERDTSPATRILHAEDSDRDAELVQRELRRAGVKFESRRVQTEADFRRALDEFHPQLILSDYAIPGFGGVAALRICREAGIDIPFIFVSGTIGEEMAVEAMKAGADDYVMKTNLVRLGPTVARALREAGLRQGGKVTETALLRAQTMAKLAHIVAGPDGDFESWSETMPQMMGIDSAAMPRNTREWLDVVHPEDRAQVRANFIEAAKTGRRVEFEYRLRRADGYWININQTSEALLDAPVVSGKPRWFGTLQDVTERKRAEESLRESEKRLRAIVNAEPECVKLVNKEGDLTEMNAAGLAMLEADSVASVRSHTLIEFVVPEHRAAFAALHRSVICGESGILEFEVVGLKGGRRWLETHAVPLSGAIGESTTLLGITRDITERKRAESKLRESEARHRAMFEQAAVGIVHSSLEGQLLLVNPTFCKVSGHAPEAATSLRIEDLIHPEDIHWCIDGRAQILAGTMAIYEKELRMLRKDGAVHWVNVTTSLVRDAGGEPAYFISIVNDISERKRAERELQRFGRAMDVSPDSIYLTDPATMRFVYLNQTACRRLGYSREELLQKGPQDVFPTPRETIEGEFADVIAAGEPGLIHERLFTRGDGSSGWSELHRRALHTDGGTLIVTIGRDITERKRAESVLALEHGVALRLAGADSAHEGLQAAMGLVCESEGWEFGRYWRVDKVAGLLRFAYAWSMPGVDGAGAEDGSREITFAPGVGLAGRVWQSGNPLWVPNVNDDARVLRQNLARTAGARGAFVFPVVAEGTTIGVLTFSSRQVRQPDERLLAAVRVIGGQIGQFLRRKDADERVKRLSRVHAVLSGINALIVRVRERDELFREACRIAVEQGGFKMAWIGIADRVAQKVVPVASAGVEAEFISLIKDRFSLREEDPLGNTRTARSVREKKTMVSNEIKDDTLILFSKERQERGIRSMAILPLLISDQAIGILALYAGEAGFFDEEELKLLHELAGDIAFAVDHIEKAGRLDYLAYYDQLTGLANRTLFLERVGQSIIAAGQADAKFALAILDIERLRTINDSLGRQAGDAVIKLVAERLTHAAGAAGVSRISADHFALVLGTVKGRSEAGRIMADALRKCFDAPFYVNDTDLRISAKAGVAQFPADGAAAEILLRNAEAALRRGKEGGDRITFHAAEMTSRIAESLTLENKLRQALQREEFVLHYQPKVDLDSRRIVGVEALIRWQSPERGLVPPMHFIPLLEETGLIVQVGAWALKRASLDHALWLRQGLNAPRVAVNVSAIQLRQRDFVQVVSEAIAGGADPTAVDIEITESQLMENITGNIEKLKALRDLGMKISIDDFGTGYSSLGYLASLPVHILKIDRSFIVAMMKNPDTMTLVSTIISLAHSLRLHVVAEGVEQEDQAKMLRLLRCDQMQGYLISKPVPLDAIAAMLRASGHG